jgi:hypothetical protein
MEQADAAVASSMATGSGSKSSSSSSPGLVQPASAVHVVDEADRMVGNLLVASGLAEATDAQSSSVAASSSEPVSRTAAEPVPAVEEPPDPPLRVAKDGYVFSNANRLVGRLTSWGKNVSMKCQAHGGSCSLAKGRHKVTDEALLAWLNRASEVVVPAGANAAEERAAAVLHKAMFQG